MPLPAAIAGSSTAPVTHTIDARWTMAHAASLGALAPTFMDTTAPSGVVAHPLFPVCVEWPAMVAARQLVDPELLPREEYVRGVHATHDLVIHRQVRPGDVLSTVATVEAVEARSPGAYEVLRLSTVDAAGSPVASTRAGSIFLGVAVDGEPAVLPVDHETFPSWPDLIDAGARLLGRVVDLPGNLAHVYTEGSRIWNPIHTDLAVAQLAGMAEPILHGTATLSIAVSEIVDAFAGGDPATVRRVACRFTGMIALPASITVIVLAHERLDAAGGQPRSTLAFEVRDPRGRLVIGAGRMLLAHPW